MLLLTVLLLPMAKWMQAFKVDTKIVDTMIVDMKVDGIVVTKNMDIDKMVIKVDMIKAAALAVSNHVLQLTNQLVIATAYIANQFLAITTNGTVNTFQSMDAKNAAAWLMNATKNNAAVWFHNTTAKLAHVKFHNTTTKKLADKCQNTLVKNAANGKRNTTTNILVHQHAQQIHV